MNSGVVEQRVERSIDRLLDHDAALFERAVHEVSVSHKLAEYLQQEFPDRNVDCEYNRHLYEVKRLEGYDSDWVRPDIIVHRRGTDDNLLVIEIKTSTTDSEDDRRKIQLYLEEIGYQYGLFLGFGKVPPFQRWFPE